MRQAVVIGGGFAGLSSACFLAKSGVEVTVVEKNSEAGGRARSIREQGFMFDMGPSWYWMPDVFERFFAAFGKRPSDYYDLMKLDPGFQVLFSEERLLEIPAALSEISRLFESIEPGGAMKLAAYLEDAAVKYRLGMQKLAYQPAASWMEFARRDVISGLLQSKVFISMSSHVQRYFSDKRLRALMEFPALFLGSRPEQTPALYSLMNYAALAQGTFYPMGGMTNVVQGIAALARSLGVKIITGCSATSIDVKNGAATKVNTSSGEFHADVVVSAADYHHTEQKLLEPRYRNYSESYWSSRRFAPSSLIFYLGVSKTISRLKHHNLFFDEDFSVHARSIYDSPEWPSKPLFYVCCPSKTDPSVAPAGCENLFILIPIAIDLNDDESVREKYYGMVMDRLERFCGQPIRPNVIYRKSYCVEDFRQDYNAYGGNAYGLANTLRQTAVLKPAIRSKKVRNLFYAGQLTVPGPGVPPAIISGEIAAQQAIEQLKKASHEAFV